MGYELQHVPIVLVLLLVYDVFCGNNELELHLLKHPVDLVLCDLEFFVVFYVGLPAYVYRFLA